MKDIKNTKLEIDENKKSTRLDLLSRSSCRICLKGEAKKNNLIRVCKCERYFEFVHSKCIENWIQLTNNEYCDICKFKFKFKKYSMSYSDFVRFECEDKTNFIQFLIITLLVLYVISIGFALAFICYNNVSKLIGLLLYASSVFFLATFIWYILIKFYIELRSFLNWKINHFNVRIKKY